MKVMKRVCSLAGSFLLILVQCVNGYSQGDVFDPLTIPTFKVKLSYNKTTNLIFPYAIKSVDRGSGDVLAQKAKGVDNILQLKAGKENFEQTNLSLVTADGKFYSFLLDFDAHPAVLNVCFDQEIGGHVSSETRQDLLVKQGLQVQAQYQFLGIGKTNQLLQLVCAGVYLSKEALWLKLHIKNSSLIVFQPAYVRFFLRDKRKHRRTAMQETEIIPIYTNSNKAVGGKEKSTWTIAFSPFTVPKNQRLVIQISDEGGGRNIELRVKGSSLLAARKLP